MSEYILASFILLFAGFTQGVTGFGSALLAIPLLTTFIDIKTAVPLCSLHGLLITGFLSFQLRSHVDGRKILPLLAGSIPGVMAGVFFLKKAPPDLLAATMGIMLIGYSTYRLLGKATKRTINPLWGYFAGFCTGAIGAALSAGGPPAIIYTTLTGWSKHSIKATLSAFFLAGGLFITSAHALSGLTTLTVLKLFGATAPAVVTGVIFGSFFYERIDTHQYLRILLFILIIMGLLMLGSSFA